MCEPKMFGIGSGENFPQKPLLYDSKVCRLCGEQNENGRPLFRSSDSSGECETSKLINQYLPVVIHDDGISPRWICPGCHIQLESTAQFFEMILKGQQQISSLLLQEKQARESQPASASKSVRVEDLGQLYDTLDQAKWNELFGKPGSEATDGSSVLVPLELFELEDLLKPESSTTSKPSAEQQSTAPEPSATSPPAPPAEATRESGKTESADMDWIVESEVTKLNGRLIGFIRNHNKSDIGSLVVMEDETGKKRTQAKFVCDICSKIFGQEFRYLKHRKTHSILFECSVCLLKFGSSVKLTIHQKQTQHNGEGIVEGVQLTSVSLTRKLKHDGASGGTAEAGSMKGGTNAKHEKPKDDAYACDNCEDTFPELTTVLKHEESVHAGESRTFVCSDCGKSFRGKNMLQRHRDTHTEGRPHQCNVCAAAFKTRSTLTKHARSHTDKKRYQCTMCDQTFAYKTSLDLHVNWHNGVKPFECEFCSKRFSQRGNLKEHLRVHSGDKPFSCGVCTATFATSSQHRLHIKRHTNDRPHECEVCNKSFILLENYKTHMRRHRNEKPFACEECTRAFAERWALRKHIRTHTREKPYICKHCSKPFSDSSNMMRHISTIHGKEPKAEEKASTVTQQPSTSSASASSSNPNNSNNTFKVATVPAHGSTLVSGTEGSSIDESEALVTLAEHELLSLDTTELYG